MRRIWIAASLVAGSALLGGCLGSAVSVEKPAPVSDAETALLAKMSPEQIVAYMRYRPAVRFGFAGADGFEAVQRDVSLTDDGKGGRTLTVHSAHKGDAEAIAALGQQVNQLATTLAPALQALAAARPAPAAVLPATAAGTPQPAGAPAGAPAGSTINTGGPWRDSDLLRLQSVNMKRAMALAGVATPPYGIRKPTADEATRFAAGLLQLGEFLSVVGPDWSLDSRVRD